MTTSPADHAYRLISPVAYLGYPRASSPGSGEVCHMAKESFQETQVVSAMSSPESGSLDSNGHGHPTQPIYDDKVQPRASVPRRILDSFRRDPHSRVTPSGVIGANGVVFDAEAAAQATADSPLARKLKGRHLQMIAIGGSIGKAFFLQSVSLVLIFIQVLVSLSPLESPSRMAVLHRY